MLDPDSQLQRLLPLIGVWIGEGHGEFPTIESFHYRETLVFRHRAGTRYLIYEQTTDLIAKDQSVQPSHWEAGIICPQGDGSLILSSTHDSTRVEVLRGEIAAGDEPRQLVIKFESVLHGNDPRMAASSREYFLNGSELSYVVRMATQKTPDLTVHLRASLRRSAHCGADFSL